MQTPVKEELLEIPSSAMLGMYEICKKPLVCILKFSCTVLNVFICLLILIIKIMLRNKCYSASLVDGETRAQRDLPIYLHSHIAEVCQNVNTNPEIHNFGNYLCS